MVNYMTPWFLLKVMNGRREGTSLHLLSVLIKQNWYDTIIEIQSVLLPSCWICMLITVIIEACMFHSWPLWTQALCFGSKFDTFIFKVLNIYSQSFILVPCTQFINYNGSIWRTCFCHFLFRWRQTRCGCWRHQGSGFSWLRPSCGSKRVILPFRFFLCSRRPFSKYHSHWLPDFTRFDLLSYNPNPNPNPCVLVECTVCCIFLSIL